MHVAIIGCGISGLLTALELLDQGCDISLFDQQSAGHAASWAGGGILSPMYPWRYPQAVNQLAKSGKSSYQKLNQKVSPISGIDFEIHETGMLIFDQEDFDVGLNYEARYQDPMQYCERLDQKSLLQINPHISSHYAEAIHFPNIANIRNPRLLKSVIGYLKQQPNVVFNESCWVDRFNIENQKIQTIQLQDGTFVEADHYVIATGAWSAHWQQQLGLQIPVKPVQGQMLLFKTPVDWLPTMCMHRVMYMIPRQDGHVVCGSSMADVGFEHRPSLEIQRKIYQACIELVPDLAHFPIVQQWAGLRPSSPTGIPYIGKMPNFNNLWANFGHFRNGLCMGPASAQLLREIMFNQPTHVDAIPYSPHRLQMVSSETSII